MEGHNAEESSPLLLNEGTGHEKIKPAAKSAEDLPAEKFALPEDGHSLGWTADGLPLGHATVVGEPLGRTQWNSGLFSCLGRNDEFCSSDLEVCESLICSFISCNNLPLLSCERSSILLLFFTVDLYI